MELWVSGRAVRIATRLRIWLLVAIALLISHDAAYVARYGIGDSLARAMSDQGHDVYWLPASVVAAILGIVVLGLGIRRLVLLRRTATGPASSDGAGYSHELFSIWKRLLPIVSALFAVQENLEHFVTHGGHLVALDPLFANLPALAATTFVLAVVGAIVRWHVRALERRVHAARISSCERPTSIHPPRDWGRLVAAVPHRWTITRLDAGRAPPRLLLAH
ncbi:MAG TPA: hypothetical protein VH720_02845 [Candidatus Limnocylindrales bacterium]